MIIDTNGFEIGKIATYPKLVRFNHYKPTEIRIEYFHVGKNGIIAVETKRFENDEMSLICNLYHTQSECQLACDKLNKESN